MRSAKSHARKYRLQDPCFISQHQQPYSSLTKASWECRGDAKHPIALTHWGTSMAFPRKPCSEAQHTEA